MDILTLKSLKYSAPHGYYHEERERGNDFEVDLQAGGDFRAAISGDQLAQTFDYEKAESLVTSVMEGQPEKLIETLCRRIGKEIFEQITVIEWLRVSVRKMNPPVGRTAKYAEITMEWKR